MPESAQAPSDRTAGSAPSSSGRSRRISGDASSPSTQPHRWRSANGVVPEMMIAVHHTGTEGSNPSLSTGESPANREPPRAPGKKSRRFYGRRLPVWEETRAPEVAHLQPVSG